jgi:hypothetical protein
LTSAAMFGTELYSSIFVQTWAWMSKVVQIMAELLPGLPNRRRDIRYGSGGCTSAADKIDLFSGGQFCYNYRSKLDEDSE